MYISTKHENALTFTSSTEWRQTRVIHLVHILFVWSQKKKKTEYQILKE